MKHTLSRLAPAAALVSLALALAAPADADAHRGGHRQHDGHRHHANVRLQDDCDPVTFNQVLGDGACVGDGDTTFDDLVGSLLATHDAPAWRIRPRTVEVRQGDAIRVRNTGGEFHTFTEVPAFGAGCVPQVNQLLGLNGPPVADCTTAFTDPQTALPAGGRGTVDTSAMTTGTHYFECVVHPWMTATVVVEHDHRHDR